MTAQEKAWFNDLSNKRKKFANSLQDPDYSGIWDVLIKGIYSEDAHFIYELLQNAEDVKATSVKFILKNDGLYFIHNGTILFTVSDINNPNANGHINAITAIGRTGKKISDTIGKFGIGFKSVFQYTKTPHIYDKNFQFKIQNYIVPELLNNSVSVSVSDYRGKDNTNTVFYFPFISEQEQTDNTKVKSKSEAYKDISAKLRDLDNPALFLSNMTEISWEIGEESQTYNKTVTPQTKGQIKYDKIELSPNNTEFYIFTRFHSENVNNINLDYSYSVGFEIKENKLKPSENSCAYCFFKTAHKTNLNFLVHAPFILNSNREAIPKNQNLKLKDNTDIEHIIKGNFNEILISQLAELAADSLLILKDLKLIDDNIISIIPYKKPQENDLFAPFYPKIKEKFKNEEILPAENGKYAKTEDAYWAEDNPLLTLFSDEQLAVLVKDENKNAKWVFRNLLRRQTDKNDDLREYIESCTNDWYKMEKLLPLITPCFIEKQDDEWLHQLYAYLSTNNYYEADLKTKEIFLDENRKAVAAFKKDGKEYHEILFLPSENLNTTYTTIHPDLLKNEKSKDFFKKCGIDAPSPKNEIYNNRVYE